MLNIHRGNAKHFEILVGVRVDEVWAREIVGGMETEKVDSSSIEGGSGSPVSGDSSTEVGGMESKLSCEPAGRSERGRDLGLRARAVLEICTWRNAHAFPSPLKPGTTGGVRKDLRGTACPKEQRSEGAGESRREPRKREHWENEEWTPERAG